MDKRRVLLIHPLGYDARIANRDISRVANLMPPLGLAGIAAYLEQHGLCADIIDCFANPYSDRITMLWKSPDSWRRFIANTGNFLRFVHANRRIAE
jgi:anaerobic magnesium-protoporphyrin IX monomethyl ester cyclase